MTTPLEQVIRPFQTRTTTIPRILPSDGHAEDTVMAFGKGGKGKVLTGSYSASTSAFMTAHQRETTRTVVTEKITNPDDESQSVNVAKTKELSTKTSKSKTVYHFNSSSKVDGSDGKLGQDQTLPVG